MKNQYFKCQNCLKTCGKYFKFCPYCGQNIKDKLTIGVLFYNTISNYFSFDARFFKSFIPLLLRPGYIAKKFVEGKRVQYLHPAQYYLFVSLIFFFLFSFKTRELNSSFDNVIAGGFKKAERIKTRDALENKSTAEDITDFANETSSKIVDENEDIIEFDLNNKESKDIQNKIIIIDSLIALDTPEEKILDHLGVTKSISPFERKIYIQLIKLYKKKASGLLQSFFDMIPIVIFFLLPIFALLLKLFYWKSGGFAYHLVFSFYYFSFLFIVFNLNIITNLFMEVPIWLSIAIILSTYFYLVQSIRKFYVKKIFATLIKTGLILFIFSLFIIPLSAVVMIMTSIMVY